MRIKPTATTTSAKADVASSKVLIQPFIPGSLAWFVP